MIAFALVTLGMLVNLAPVKEVRISKEDFEAVVAAFHKYHETTKRGPGSAEELLPYLKMKEEESKRLIDLLQKKELVFHYNVSLGEMTDGAGKTILAYAKATPKEGGLTLFADGEVKKLTADEFKDYKIARPKITTTDLRTIGIAYQTSCEVLSRAPTKAEELGQYMDKARTDVKRLTNLLKNDDIIFIYGVRLQDMFTIGTSLTIIAYERNTGNDGGLVLHGDCSARTLTAGEFKRANLAKPPKPQKK